MLFVFHLARIYLYPLHVWRMARSGLAAALHGPAVPLRVQQLRRLYLLETVLLATRMVARWSDPGAISELYREVLQEYLELREAVEGA